MGGGGWCEGKGVDGLIEGEVRGWCEGGVESEGEGEGGDKVLMVLAAVEI